MISNDRQPSLRLECVAKRGKSPLKVFQLSIHRDPDCLEDPGEVSWSTLRPQDRADGVNQVVARAEVLPLPTPHDLGSQTPCSPFVSVVPENLFEGSSTGFVQQAGRRSIIGAHPHVERRTRTEGKTPALIVQLPGRDPQIKEYEIRFKASRRLECLRRAVRSLEILDVALAQTAAADSNSLRVPVNSEDLRAHAEECGCVAAISQCGIDHPACSPSGFEHRRE